MNLGVHHGMTNLFGLPTPVFSNVMQPSEAHYVAPVADVWPWSTSTTPVSEETGSTVLWDQGLAKYNNRQWREEVDVQLLRGGSKVLKVALGY